MTTDELLTLLRPYLEKNPHGCYDGGFFDLDHDPRRPDSSGFSLWLDDDVEVRIPLPVDRENALLIQRVINALGRRLLHTWGAQYSEDVDRASVA